MNHINTTPKFVFVSIKEKKKLGKKRVVIPSSMSSLRAAIEKIFKLNSGTIKIVYSPNEKEITSTNKLENGKYYIASIERTKDDFLKAESIAQLNSTSRIDQTTDEMHSSEINNILSSPEIQGSKQRSDASNSFVSQKVIQPPPSLVPKLPNIGFNMSSSSVSKDVNNDEVANSSGSGDESEINNGTTAFTPKPEELTSLNAKSQEEIVYTGSTGKFWEEEENTMEVDDIRFESNIHIGSVLDENVLENNGHNGNVTDECIVKDNRYVDNMDENNIIEDNKFDESEHATDCITGLLNNASPVNNDDNRSEWVYNDLVSSEKDFEDALKAIPLCVRRFVQKSKEIQFQQQSYILKNFSERVVGEMPRITDSVLKHARDLLNSSVVTVDGDSFINTKTVVVGPPKSGKSTYLKIVMSEMFDRFLLTGQFKKTFLFYIDFDIFIGSFDSPLKVYNTMITSILDQISIHRVELTSHIDTLKKYFVRLLTLDSFVPLPRNFAFVDEFRGIANHLTKIGKNLFNTYKEEQSLQLFYSCVFTLPKYLSLAFGFINVFFVADHMDTTDVDCIAGELSDDYGIVPIIEFVKLMISESPYIISCHSEDLFLDMIDLMTERGVDIRSYTNIVTVVGADNGEEHGSDIRVNLTIENSPSTYISRSSCAGCPGFLSLWDEIYNSGTQLIKDSENSQESKRVKETKLALIVKVRELARLVFEGDDGEDIYTPYSGHIMDIRIEKV